MRLTATAASVSWIPTESLLGPARLAFDIGVTHYDEPPPDRVVVPADLYELCRDHRVRFANVVSVWAELDNGKITSAGFAEDSGLVMGETTVTLASLGVTFRGVSFPTLRRDPELADDHVTFAQTVGGRAGVPAPRPVQRRPFLQWVAPTVWTTLALTLRAEGGSEVQLRGASTFPRHWVYGSDGRLALKSGLTEEGHWFNESFGNETPWGSHDDPVLVSAVESELERQMSTDIMQPGRRPEIRRLRAGVTLTRQGEPGDELILVLDGVVSVVVDGTTLGEVGPGAVLGERAVLEGGRRTATLIAATPVRLAVASAAVIDRSRLARLAEGHRREG